MAKGLFTQGVCLLTDGTTDIDAIAEILQEKEFDIVKKAPPQKDWRFGGPTLVVDYLSEDNGYVAVDVVNEVWPDSMGDPKKDPMTFGAWSMGHFGPYAFPGGLARAKQHCLHWKDGPAIADQHRGFVRLRLSYAFGAKDQDPVFPADYDPLAELLFLNDMVRPLLKAPGVLCYFNPNGEVLRDRASFGEVYKVCKEQEKIPLPLWTNVRYFGVNDRLGLMDTIGNAQLDLRDVEAVFPRDRYDADTVHYYTQNVSLYLLGLDRELTTGEEIDGPGESDLGWTMEVLKQGAADPPRRALRLYPKKVAKEVRQAIATP